MKLVSVILFYNRDRGFLDEAIESVENQTYPKVELILSQSHGNSSFNLNEGLKRCNGDYIRFLCEDDLLPKDSIEKSVKAMGDFDFIHGNAVNLYPNGKEIEYRYAKPVTLKTQCERNRIHGGTVMYKRGCFEKVGGFDESLQFAEEYEFNCRLLYHGYKLGYCDNILYKYRIHEEQKCAVRSEPLKNLKRVTIRKIQGMYDV
jgi:teichuronic acid biosynthesis glycosyltransferase TuaG